ncbi:hypothetical protein [Oceanobacillus profundus]|uniref:hypothetical protein n=2 Tax=Oceanobacillus TaxID=182709 RepID=UPI0026E11C77|nr:hypothetical protein [Oceanobacillus profundus]
MNFTDDELAIVYEAVSHMGAFRDILYEDSKIGETTRNVLEKIKEKNQYVTSSMYVSNNIIED